MSFDVAAARQAGYSDLEIADFLGQQRGFDTAAARRAGYSNADILSHLNTQLAPTMPMGAGRPTTQPSTAEQAGRSGLQRNIFDPVERGFQNLMIGAASTRALSPDSIFGLDPEEAAAAITRRQRRLAEIPRTEASQRAFREAEETESIPGAVGRLASSSAALGDIGLESLGTNPVAAPVGALANVVRVPVLREAIGALAGALGFPTEYLTSVSNGVMEAAQRRGVDVNDPAQLSALLREINANPELRGDIRSDALVRAGIISAADAVAGYGAGRVVTRGVLGRVGGGAAIEAAGGGLGEAGAQLATEGRISPAEIAAEIIGGGGMGALGNIRQSPTPGQDPALQSAIEQIVRSRGGALPPLGSIPLPGGEPPAEAPAVTEAAPAIVTAPPTAAPALVGQGNLFAQPEQPARPEVAPPEAAAPEAAPAAPVPPPAPPEPAPPVEAAPAAPERAPEPPAPVSFTTALGSTYEVNEEGQTIRTKRSPGRGQGTTYPPHNALFVDPNEAENILEDLRNGGTYRFVVEDNGVPRVINAGESIAGKRSALAVFAPSGEFVRYVPSQTRPAVGLSPVELRVEETEDGRQTRRHIGNPITEVRGAEPTSATAPAVPEAPPAPKPVPEAKPDWRLGETVDEAPEVPDVLPQNVKEIVDYMRKGRRAEPKGQVSLIQAIIKAGGLKDTGGEIKQALGGTAKTRPGLLNRKGGLQLDEAAEYLTGRGYFIDFPTDNELLDAIDDEIAKRAVNYGKTADARGQQLAEAVRDLQREMDIAGVSPQNTDAEIARALGIEPKAEPRTLEDVEREDAARSAFSARGAEAKAEAPALSAKQKRAQEKAERTVKKFLSDLRSRGRQARIFAGDLERLLKDRTMTAEQIYRGFMVADTLANTIPAKADYRLRFVQDLVVESEEAGRASGAEVGQRAQGRVIYPEQGSIGLIELSLAKDMLPYLNETAAHEGFHILQTYFAEYDKAFADRINKSFKEDMKISDLEPSIKRRLQALKPPGSKVSYYDSLVQGLGEKPLSVKEAQAYAFGSLVDAANRGKPTAGILPPFQRFVLFAKEFMAKLKSALNKEGFESPADLLVSAQRRGARMTQTAPLQVGAAYSGRTLPPTIDVDGVSRPTLNSEGRQIHPTEEGVRNFWRWFGDSKVVDGTGRPLVVYHGTSKDKDFTSFNVPKRGAWFATDPAEASSYANENDSRAVKYDWNTQRFQDVNTAARVLPVYLSIKNPVDLTQRQKDRLSGKTGEENYARVQGDVFSELRAAGADGVQASPDVWVALKDPTQVKSAIGNLGTFKPTEKRIQYSARSTGSTFADETYRKISRELMSPVVYQDRDVALIEAVSGNGKPIYVGVSSLKGGRTLRDVADYNGSLFSREELNRLLKARDARIAETERLSKENPKGPFADSNTAFDKDFPEDLRGFANGIVKELGLSDEKILFFTFDKAKDPDFIDRNKLYGDYFGIKDMAFYPQKSPGVYGLARNRNDGKYRAIAINSSKRQSVQMEVLAHEIGHIFDSVALQKASPETIREIENSFRRWLKEAEKKPAREYVKLLRTPVTGKLQGAHLREGLTGKDLNQYSRSFSEWFADQVARWSLTSEPAKTLIGKFFQRIAAAYRSLVNRLGATAQPDATVAKFIEQRRAATTVIPPEPQASFGFDKPKQTAFGFAGPGKPEQITFGFSVDPNFEDVEVAAPEQRISSAGTSVKQIPATFKTVNFKPGTVNLDYGGGRYDLGTDYLREKGVESFVYDKFNRSEEHNRDVLARVGQGGADTVTVNNVLNVVAEPEVRDFIIQDAGRYLKPDGTAYFLVYEGDKSGTGKETSKGFQNNAKAEDYIPAIREHFGQVSRKGNLIAAKSPKASASGQAARTQYSARQVAPQYAARVSGQVAGLAPFGQRTPPATMSATQRAELNVQYDVVSKALSKRFGRFIPPAKIESFFMKFQDKMLPVGRMIDEIREAGGNITVAMDAYLKEDLLQGKVATMLEKRSQDLYNPLVKAVADSGLSMQDFENFLYARHAPERNAYVASINPDMPDGGSGLTNQQAKDMMREFQQQGKTAKLTELAKMFDAIIADTNKLRVEAGLTPDFSIIKTTEDGRPLPDYKDYAPLRNFVQESVDGEETVKEFRPKSGKALGARGREDKRVTGRERLAGDILAHAMMQNTQAVIRSEQNKVGQSFLAMIRANPEQSKGFAEVITSAPLRTTIVNGVVKTMPDPTYKNDPDVLVVKENGKEVAIRIFDENVARAMTGASALSPASKNILVQGMASVNRFLAKVNTAYNPEFLITNFARDLQTFGINVQQFDVDGLTKDVMGDLKGSLSGIRDVTRGTNNNPEMARYFERFRELGGTTDMYGFADIETRIAEINEVMSKVGTEAKSWKDMAKAVAPVIKFLEDYNTIVENGVRTALFKNLVERGFNEEQAAQAAKNITVNFSKGGENRVFMNAMYLFYNASLQGTMAMVNAIGRSPRVRKIVAGVVVAGVLQDVLNSMLSGEDDDDDKIYDKIPDHVLKRSFVLMDPFQITERGYFSFPMPYGFNAFFNMGREMSKTARGATDPMKAAGSIVGTFVDSFNPIGGSESILNFIAPTIIDPVVDIVENRDFAGRPIVPERGGFGPQPPESQKYWGNTFAPYVAISDFLNEVTGGTRVIPGAVDISPNLIQYAVNYATGGVGKFVERSFNTVTGTIPDALRGDLSEVDVKGIPLVRSLYGNVTTRSDTERYMGRMEEVLRVRQEIRDASQYGQPERVEAAMRRYPGQVEIMESFSRISRERAQISQRINEINRNPNIDADSKKEIIKLLRDQQNALVGVANQLYNQSVERRQ